MVPQARRALSPTAAVGRIGKLSLEYVRRDGRTVFGRTHCQTPWHLLPPIYLDETGSAYTLLVNPSGGLVGGDHVLIDLSVGPEAHVLISTPSANRVYRSVSKASVQDIRVSVGTQGRLEWFPEHTIPFSGSRFRQSIDVALAPGAVLLFWDAMASGRIARGERWAFTSLENRIRISTACGDTASEHYAIDREPKRRTISLMEEWDYLGSLFIIGDSVGSAIWNRLEVLLAEILETQRGEVLGGVSQPAAPGLVVKLVAKSAPVLSDVLSGLWGAARRALWNLPPVLLRKY
ncbi:MAG TPA: urease accessory protein UreD [Nitrospira sp.]|nr:urease accessory protein UreD [Nitrospira sp.]